MPPPLRHAAPAGIRYRPLTDDDYGFTESLYLSTRADELALSGWPEAERRQFLRQQHHAQHFHYQRHYPAAEWLIVERGDAAIGRLYLEEWSDQFRIIDISLVAEARGCGVGTAILRDILAHAETRGKAASIHVEKVNPARNLYLRLGFETVEDKGVYDLMIWRSAAITGRSP